MKRSFVARRAHGFLAAILAAFFVYNTITIAIPSVQAGLILLAIVGYITIEFYTYKGLSKRQLFDVFAASFIIAGLLGVLFGQVSVHELSSLDFFTSKAFIAFLASLPATALVKSWRG